MELHTRTLKILRLLALDPNLNAGQVAEKLDIPAQTARQALADMKQHGYLKSKPVTYSITEHGVSRLRVVPKTPKKHIDRAVARRREKRELSISGIPNSVFALGGMV